ncbi:hypothetical protein SBADM41S_10050 [Streptomyces badius]
MAQWPCGRQQAQGGTTGSSGGAAFWSVPLPPGSNENTDGLLRQYFLKGTDLSVHTREHLDAVAAELNSRPRKTLGRETPVERLAKLLATAS